MFVLQRGSVETDVDIGRHFAADPQRNDRSYHFQSCTYMEILPCVARFTVC